MNPASTFIKRPVATTLLTIGLTLAGAVAFFLLPVSPLPQVDFPTINVQATLPGASPETVSTSVATPLERYLGRIADVSEMTSMSTVGSANITLQFGLNRDINGAARDVQAAINAARVDLPASLRSNPVYRKLNPADAPILILTLASKTRPQGQIYDVASTVLAQKLAQVEGVGEVRVGGSSLPAVRVELNPTTLFKYGIGLEDVRAALSSANANTPKGAIEDNGTSYQIYMNDQARVAADYKDVVIAYRNDAPVILSQVAHVIDSVEDTRNTGLLNGDPAVLLIISRQPGANIIATVDRVKELIPALQGSIPNDIVLSYASDRTTTIRGSLLEVEMTLLIAICLVIGVVLLFLKDPRAALIPAVVVPVSLIGTFGVMYLCDYSLDNLSLMALTVATGFVVDDAVVVLENISRHMENGMPRMEAALRGAREVGFTVLSMSVSLIAVFIPILLMGGIIGRLFREFAVVLSVAIIVSLVVSLSTTPMMCAYLLRHRHDAGSPLFRFGDRLFRPMQRLYERTLDGALVHPGLIGLSLLLTVIVNVYLYGAVPKGFFPQQDSGRLVGNVRADQSASFQSMREKFTQLQQIMKEDPAVDIVVGFASGQGGFTFAQLKPLEERKISSDAVIARLRPKLAQIAGAQLFLQSAQEFRMGGRASAAQFQYTLQGDNLEDLRTWTPKIVQAVKTIPGLADVDSDQQEKGLEIRVTVDRDTASRLGLTAQQIDNNLYDFFGQRQVSTIYNPLNQYHVVMEVAPEFRDTPQALDDVYVASSGAAVSGVSGTNAVAGTYVSAATTASTAATVANDAARNRTSNQVASVSRGSASTGSAVSTRAATMIPLSAVADRVFGNTPVSVNHQGLFVASTVTFNLLPGTSIGQATERIGEKMKEIGVPSTIQGGFAGSAKAFQDSVSNQPMLILTALLAVYIVLGMLYESYVHPLTILSTLPSAGVGALIALLIFDIELNLMALIGIILLIGIVKKNAIMMVDFALEAERTEGRTPLEAIREACLLRFRPIMMTTLAALLGALPLAVGHGEGGELRQPLGVAIVGGLIFSQVLTLYTTPIVYLGLDRMRLRAKRKHATRKESFA